MRRINREISVFSVSAIDLFASALGAFIVLSLAALPFFSNTDKTGRVLELLAQVRAAERALADATATVDRQADRIAELEAAAEAQTEALVAAEAARAAAEAEAARATAAAAALEAGNRDLAADVADLQDDLKQLRLPPLEIVMAVDFTSSFKDMLQGLDDEIETVLDIWGNEDQDLLLTLAFYGDRSYPRPFFVSPRISNRDPNAMRTLRPIIAQHAADASRRGNNQEFEEALDRALDYIARHNWAVARESRVVIVQYDNPCYREQAARCRSLSQTIQGQVGRYVYKYRRPPGSQPTPNHDATMARFAQSQGAAFLDTAQSWFLPLLN